MEQKFPILEYDPERRAIIEPQQVVRPAAVPQHCVLTFFQREIHKLNQNKELRQIKKLKSEMGSHLVFGLETAGGEVALFNPGVGAPFAAAMFEEIIALGCRKFIVCGSAGVLDATIAMGHILLVTSAVRDEGTSYHYLPPAREVAAHPAAVAALEQTLQAHRLDYSKVKTWTTDAIYRETPQKIRRRKSEGCQAVEMEAAALLAVAAFRQVILGQILYSGDCIGGTEWDSRNWTRNTEIREKLIRLAAEACLRL